MIKLFAARNKLPMIYQTQINECGLACLTMISQFYGNRTSLNELRNLNNVFAKGASLNDIMGVAASIELSCRPLKIELSDLKRIKLPCILHWDLDHFIVLSRVGKSSITIHDPAKGIRRYTFSEIGVHVSGVALELSPASEFSEKKATSSLRLSDLFRPDQNVYRAAAKILLMSILLQSLSILSPLYLQLVIDQGINLKDSDLITLLALLFIILTVFKTGVNYFRGIIALQLSNQVGFGLAQNTFNHLLRLPLRYFEQREMGDIVSRFGSLDSVKALVTQDMIILVVDGLFSLLTVLLLYFYSPMLCMFALLTVCLYAIIRGVSIGSERNLRQEALICSASQQTTFMENVRTITTTKLFGIENEREQDWLAKHTDSINSGYHLGSFQLVIATAQSLVFGLDHIATVYFGASMVMEQELSLGQLMSFIFLKQHFISSMTAMIPKLAEVRMLQLELDRLADIVLQKRELKQPSRSLYLGNFSGEIEFRNVCFRYAENCRNIIENLSIKIASNESIGVCGSSGCGKTTFLKLLLDLESPSSGEILIDGSSINAANSVEHKKRIAAITHGETLLSGSLAYNINLSREPFSEKKLFSVCDTVGISDVIRALPMGLATQVGELGVSFSAGQIQRVLLARVLYQQPRIIVLDESLSHLGDADAIEIVDRIKRLGISIIMVSHNPKLLAQSDRLLMLDKSTALTVCSQQLLTSEGYKQEIAPTA